MIKQLLNLVIAKYRDLIIIDLLATDKSRYFASSIIVNCLNELLTVRV